MPPAMKRNVILCGLLLASGCSGGGSGQSTATGGTLGSTHDTSGIIDTRGTSVSAKPDPALGFREQFSNSGGMWLPQQMLRQ